MKQVATPEQKSELRQQFRKSANEHRLSIKKRHFNKFQSMWLEVFGSLQPIPNIVIELINNYKERTVYAYQLDVYLDIRTKDESDESNHTPGPWVARKVNGNFYDITVASTEILLARVYDASGCEKANANLMALSPRLAEILIKLVDAVTGDVNEIELLSITTDARNLIQYL